ncbi:MAG: hypothetical protein QOD80_2030 [Verrucomicrobiota bacterium]|jgi:hypothetical protein
MSQIIVTANVVVPNGPQFAFQQTIVVDGYDKIDVLIPATPATTDKKVELVAGSGEVQFIAITSDFFSDKLTYKINSSAAATTVRKLDQPQLFMGKGAVSLFDAAPATLFFSNAAPGQDAQVQILIGRDATP